jgi:hypothetical protein
MARQPLAAYWWAEARPMPMGELAPVMIATLLGGIVSCCLVA